MAQTRVKISRLVGNIRKTSAYTPLVEAVANSIDAINEINQTKGEISILAYRSPQGSLGQVIDDELPPFVKFVIRDNGVGFNDKNLESFNTIYTDKKIREGGKGVGRFVFLKYFDEVKIESVFAERGAFYKRKFRFVQDDIIIQDESNETLNEPTPLSSSVTLDNLRLEHINKLDKKIETLSRKLLEKLLVYFAIDNFSCPKISIIDVSSGTTIILNNLIGSEDGISNIKDGEFTLENEDKTVRHVFKVKVFKVFYGESRSSITLVADKRQVTDEALYTYIPEFKGDFYESYTDNKGQEHSKNYKIKTYTQGKYLDDNVSTERDGFYFTEVNPELFYPFNRAQIERAAAEFTKNVFPEEISTRQEKKGLDIKKYIDEKAPWHRNNLKDLDFSSIPYNPTDLDIETALEKVRFEKEKITREEVQRILATTDEADVAKRIQEIIAKVDDVQKAELAHYVALRRAVIDLFKKSLEWGDDKRHEKEEVVHQIIFPMKGTSETTEYEQHNLWLLDERLSYAAYTASDKPLNKNDERPDILIFDNPIAMREGDELSNPISVFELKRPQRNEYEKDENPLQQMADYVEKIRKGDYTGPKGRPINAGSSTPAYGYLVCDITPKIESFCKMFQLKKSPDGKGFFGFHSEYQIYFEVISFDKVVKDSEQRNRIFFKKLGIQ
jgi:anti-sigma regulatory factor (Ser/Thr protein kinase)